MEKIYCLNYRLYDYCGGDYSVLIADGREGLGMKDDFIKILKKINKPVILTYDYPAQPETFVVDRYLTDKEPEEIDKRLRDIIATETDIDVLLSYKLNYRLKIPKLETYIKKGDGTCLWNSEGLPGMLWKINSELDYPDWKNSIMINVSSRRLKNFKDIINYHNAHNIDIPGKTYRSIPKYKEMAGAEIFKN